MSLVWESNSTPWGFDEHETSKADNRTVIRVVRRLFFKLHAGNLRRCNRPASPRVITHCRLKSEASSICEKTIPKTTAMSVIVSVRFSTYPIGRENNQRRTAGLPRSALESASMNAVCGKHGK
jgi:hypothetical protein